MATKGSLPKALTLDPDERLLWASKESGTAGYPQWAITLAALGALFVLGPIFGVTTLVLSALLGDLGGAHAVVLVVSAAAPLLVFAALAAAWALPRFRLTHFLTSKRVVSQTLFGGLRQARLDQVRGVERLVVEYRSRYGVQEVVTDRLRFTVGSDSFLFGPSRDIERVLDLVDNGVLTRWVDLSTLPALALPGLPAPPAPAEEQETFFLCATTRTGGDVYGPLFVGPRVIVRITEELPFHSLGRLYTTLAGAVDGEAAELLFFEVLRMSSTGHFIELPRAGTTMAVAGDRVSLSASEGRQIDVGLPAGAGARLRALAALKVPEPSEPLSMTARLMGKSAPRAATRPPAQPGAPSAETASTDAPSTETASTDAPSTDAAAPGAAVSETARVPAATATPDLLDPTASESEARTLTPSALSQSDQKELAAALKSDRRILFAPARFFSEHRALVLLTLLTPVVTLLAVGTRFGAACTPTQEWVWVFFYALGLVAPAYLAFTFARHQLHLRTSAIPPGLYVLPRDVVVARSGAIRVVPLSQVAAIGSARPLPLASHAELTLWIEGEPAESCFVPGDTIEALVPKLEAAQKAASAPVARDPFEAFRRSDAFGKASRARPRSSVAQGIAIATLAAVLLALPLYQLRNALSDGVALASAGTDTEALRCYAEAGGRDADRVLREVIPHAAYLSAHELGEVAALTDFLTAYPDAPDAETARREREELAWSTARRDVWSLSAFVAAYPASSHIPEAVATLPGLALADAREQNDVASLTNVIRLYEGSPEAEEATRLRHARYTTALESLRARGSRPEVLAYVERLFAHLEAHDGTTVRVRFRAPSLAALDAMDATLGQRNGGNVEPIAPSFSLRASRLRETLVFDRLRDGFASFADADVLPLDHGMRLPERLTEREIAERIAVEGELGTSSEELAALAQLLREQNDPATEAPEIRIDYVVVPTGDIYTLETVSPYGDPLYRDLADLGAPRRFAGFRVDFTVELLLGAEPERPVLRFSVTPPPSLSVDGGADEPTTGAIYDRLATAAFDQLGTELSGALYGQ